MGNKKKGKNEMNGCDKEFRDAVDNEPSTKFSPALALYHTSPKGIGSALKMRLFPATAESDGYLQITIANQKSIGDMRGANPVYPSFDWDNQLVCNMEFDDLCHMLQVFRGETEVINDGRGLYSFNKDGAMGFCLSHKIEPRNGYHMEMSHLDKHTNVSTKANIFLSSSEAVGICEAIATSIGMVVFGIPSVIPHE